MTKISEATLTTPVDADLIPFERPGSAVARRTTRAGLFSEAVSFGAGVTVTGTLAANGAVTVAGQATLSGLVTIQKDFTYPSSYPLRIVGGMSSPVDAPCVQLSVENDTDGESGTNLYDGGAFIKLRAGATAKRARYLMFTDHNDAPDWYTGANSSGYWILYRSGGAHRLWLEGSESYINAEGDAAVHINYHGGDSVGKGGLRVWSGGTSANQSALFSVQPDDLVNTPASDVSVIINAGKTTDQTSRIYFKRQNANKFALTAGASQTFSLYDYQNTTYAFYWNGSALAIGHAAPINLLTPIKEDTATNTVTNVIAIGHNSTGTPAAGFGTAITFFAESATVVNRNLGRLYFEWGTATDTGRASLGRLTSFYETTERTALRWGSSASEALLAFFATAPVGKQTVTGSRGGNAAVASLLSALAAYGLITDSTSA